MGGHSETLSESCTVVPRFRRLVPYVRPSSVDDAVSVSLLRFLACSPHFFILTVEASWFDMLLISCGFNLNLTVFPRLYLTPDQAALCVDWVEYFPEYSFINLNSSMECPGSCIKHVLPLVDRILKCHA